MKKKLPLFLLSLTLLPLSSCSSGSESIEKVALDCGTIRFNGDEINARKQSQMEQIDLGELNDMLSRKSNFVLLLGNSFDCSCWVSFHNDVLAPYLLEEHIYLPWISYEDGSKKLAELGADISKDHETLMIFKEGEIAYQHTTSDASSSWVSDKKTFRSWMNERIESPRLLTLSKEQLDDKYAGSADFSILFSRSTCSDCRFLLDNDIKSYFASNIKKTTVADNYLYLLDCDVPGIRLFQGEDGKAHSPDEEVNDCQKQAAAQWKAFKEEYGLAYSDSNEAGWDEGYVPTIFHIHPDGSSKAGDVIDFSGVFYNETIENGVVAESYFSKARQEGGSSSLDYLYSSNLEFKCLEGISLSLSEGAARKEINTALEPYEKPILNLLLDSIL